MSTTPLVSLSDVASTDAATPQLTDCDTNQAAPSAHKPLCLDRVAPLHVTTFPNPPAQYNRPPPTTIANIKHVLDSYGVKVQYDVICKRLRHVIPGRTIGADNADNIALTEIISLCVLNGLQPGLVPASVEAIADQRTFNPVKEWIQSKPWDGIDRLPAIQNTLTVREHFPLALRDLLIEKWLLSAVAAAMLEAGFRSRGVLTLQGPQSSGKTSWVLALVPEALRASLLKIDHHIDPSNKDTVLGAIGHWIVEIGELDSSFRKDVARIKGILTSPTDKVRRPYAKSESEYPRRTVFCATVNDSAFLVDTTGNSRWWTLPVVAVNFQHGIDMQQVFAQLAVKLQSGAEWWLTKAEEQDLAQQNMAHMTISVIREKLLDHLEKCAESGKKIVLRPMKAIEVLKMLDFETPTNPQAKECAGILRERFGESKRIKGAEKWNVPVQFDKWADMAAGKHGSLKPATTPPPPAITPAGIPF